MTSILLRLFCFFSASFATAARTQISGNSKHLLLLPVQVAPGGHLLQTTDARSFFWLGDTAWELIHHTTREEASYYLQTRSRQDFTVIQTAVLSEFDGVTQPSALGEKPFLHDDVSQPNPAYFDRVLGLPRPGALDRGSLPWMTFPQHTTLRSILQNVCVGGPTCFGCWEATGQPAWQYQAWNIIANGMRRQQESRRIQTGDPSGARWLLDCAKVPPPCPCSSTIRRVERSPVPSCCTTNPGSRSTECRAGTGAGTMFLCGIGLLGITHDSPQSPRWILSLITKIIL